MDELELLRDEVKRLRRERAEALAVANDRREDLGFGMALVDWLNQRCATHVKGGAATCYDIAAHVEMGPLAPHCHARHCEGAAWARKVGGLQEVQRQVDAAHAAAWVEDKVFHARRRRSA